MRGKKLYSRLKSHRRKLDRRSTLTLILLGLALLIAASTAAFLTFSAWFYLLLLIPIGLGLYYFLTRPNLYQVARRIEAEDPSWIDRLSTAVDLAGKDNPREVYSQELTSEYVEGIETRLTGHPLIIDRKGLLYSSLLIFAGSLLTGLLLGLLFTPRMEFGARCLFAPQTRDLRIEALNADTLVDQNDRVELTALVSAPINLKYVYLISEKGDESRRFRVKVEDDTARFKTAIKEEQTFTFARLGRSSDEVYLGLRQPFEIRNISLRIIPPSYTGEKPQQSAGTVLRALPGSEVTIHGKVSAQLSAASLRIGDSALDMGFEGTEFSGSFQLTDPERDLNLSLTSRTGTEITQRIAVEPRGDEIPLVEVFLPGKDSDVSSTMELTLGVHVLDDYGLGQVRLVAEGGTRMDQVITRSGGRTEDTVFYRWDVNQLGMLPGDQIEYYVQASDNDAFSGPKWGRSKTYVLRFPDINELFSEVSRHGEETAGSVEELLERQEELSMEMSRIEEKLRAEQGLSEQERQRLEELIAQQEQLMGSIDSLAEETRKLLDEMEKGMITDPETMSKLSDLSDMLSQLMPPELQRELAELSQALSQNPEMLSEMLQNTSSQSGEMQMQLEQALSVLEKFLQEQSLQELAQKAHELSRMQDELLKDAPRLSPNEAQARQDQISQGIEELSNQAEELAADIDDQEIADMLRELADQMSGENKNLSSQVSKSMQSGKMDKKTARQLSENLDQAGMQLSGMLAQLQRNRQGFLDQEMARLTRELIILSEEQERLLAQINEEDNLELAAKATEIERALERSKQDLYALASQSMKVPRQAMHNLAAASQDQTRFKDLLIEGKSGTASRQGRQSQQMIDRTASVLLESKAQSSGMQGSQTGLEQLMQSLSAMSLAQLSINQQMGGLLPLPLSADQMSAAQSQALGDLLAQQSALRQELEQMVQSGGMEPGLSGMMEGIIQEMRQLEQDMAAYTGQREYVDRGEKIFRRFLDARNVLRKQGETTEREREIGSPWEALTSPDLPIDAGERRLYLKKELMRFLQTEYPEEYKRLAKAYLEALLEEQ